MRVTIRLLPCRAPRVVKLPARCAEYVHILRSVAVLWRPTGRQPPETSGGHEMVGEDPAAAGPGAIHLEPVLAGARVDRPVHDPVLLAVRDAGLHGGRPRRLGSQAKAPARHVRLDLL